MTDVEKKSKMVIGLTGGIGTGKSTVAEYLKRPGIYHIDADQIGRDLTTKGSPLVYELDSVFGPLGELGLAGKEIVSSDGELDRKALAAIAFAEYSKKERLDDIMLKHIIAEVDRRKLEAMSSDEIVMVIIDAPLLFEAGLETRCDKVLLVTADMDVRIDRVCKRDNTEPQDVRNRISCQMSDQEKREKSHIIVDNSKGLKELYDQLDNFIKEYL